MISQVFCRHSPQACALLRRFFLRHSGRPPAGALPGQAPGDPESSDFPASQSPSSVLPSFRKAPPHEQCGDKLRGNSESSDFPASQSPSSVLPLFRKAPPHEQCGDKLRGYPESSDSPASQSPSSVLPSFRKAQSAYPESSDFLGIARLILLALTAFGAQPVAADPLGRLFTTPQQRQKLDELRRAETDNPEIQQGPSNLPQDAPAQVDAPVNPITVRGLVTRKGGRSMAFLNESNTYEGDLASEYIRVRSGDIEGEEIRIYTPYGDDAVALKVGQTLEPSTGRIIDLTDEEVPARDMAVPPADPDTPTQPTPPGE